MFKQKTSKKEKYKCQIFFSDTILKMDCQKQTIHAEICSCNSCSNKNTSKKKKYDCAICGKSFSITGDLTRHLSAVHMHEKKFNCEICGKGYSSKRGLLRHMEIHKEDDETSLKSGKYWMPQCFVVFKIISLTLIINNLCYFKQIHL